jgi:dolichol-phosphate mannosyltransferase
MTRFGVAAQGASQRAAAIAGDIAYNLAAWTTALVGPPRKAARQANYLALLRRHLWQGVTALGLVVATMVLVDPLAGAVRALPFWVVSVFAEVTDFGRSSWVLIPTGTLILILAALASPALDRFSRGVLAALAVRVGFVFVAIGLPALVGSIVKRMIGRVRPSAEAAFAYHPFSWRPDFASLPSGHAITAFGALVAIGLLVPRARPLLWVYAITIAVSRIVVSAHFPSDVIAGAAFGAFGAILVREWFASRRLGFFIDSEGTVRAFPSPSLARARRAIGAGLDRRVPSDWRAAALALPSLLHMRVSRAIGRALERKSQFEWNAAALALPRRSRSRASQAIEDAPGDKFDFDWNGNLARPPTFETTESRSARMTNAQESATDVEQAPADNAEQPYLSVVVPVRNEAGNVGPLIEEIATSLAAKASFEVVYVDDGSTDGTAAEIDRLMKERPWLRHVGHAVSCGQSAAISTGVTAARAALVVTLDGDGQNDPAFLPTLIERLEQNPRVGLVAGQRVGRKATGFKRLQSRIANKVRSAVLRDGTRDTGCGLKAFRRDVFLALPYFDGLHRFLPALVRRDGHDIAYLDVIDRQRRAGKSNYGMWDRLWIGILDLAGVWWLIRRRARVPQVVEVLRNAG